MGILKAVVKYIPPFRKTSSGAPGLLYSTWYTNIKQIAHVKVKDCTPGRPSDFELSPSNFSWSELTPLPEESTHIDFVKPPSLILIIWFRLSPPSVSKEITWPRPKRQV